MAAIDDDFSLYILIKTGSRKYNNIMYNSSVSFVFTDLYEFETLQIEAIAQEEFDLDTEIKYIEKLQCIMAKMGRANLPSQKIKKGKFIVIKAIPYWVRYGNFGHGESFDVFKKIIDTQPQ